MINEATITASVKVMRSHDYCHFEVALASTLPLTMVEIDALRKEAARLADKAVQQYKIAKANAARLNQEKSERDWFLQRAKNAESVPESERSPDQKALVKQLQDETFMASRAYDYEDDWNDDCPF